MNPNISDQEETVTNANAVSLFGQGGGMNDFPVLKAFQEYIDAEQAKARKRMFGLSIFFIVLLVVVVVTFTIVMTSVIGRNQALSDRLLDIALREKPAAQPVVNVQPSMPSPVVQPSVESAELVRLREELQREKEARQAEQTRRDKEKIESLTAALAKAQQQPPAPAPVVVTTPAPVVQSAAESAELIRLREELRREKEERKAEQEKAKEEKRKADIEAHRRRLYPEYYAQQDALKNVPPVPVAPVPQLASVPRPAPASKPAPAPKLRTMQPVSYFNSSVPDEDPELKELLKKNAPSQPAPKPVATPAAKPAPKPAATIPVPSKPAPVMTTAPVKTAAAVPSPSQPASKPAAKPVATKPASVPAKPAQKPQSTTKTETLAIGGTTDGETIPWLIELPKN